MLTVIPAPSHLPGRPGVAHVLGDELVADTWFGHDLTLTVRCDLQLFAQPGTHTELALDTLNCGRESRLTDRGMRRHGRQDQTGDSGSSTCWSGLRSSTKTVRL